MLGLLLAVRLFAALLRLAFVARPLLMEPVVRAVAIFAAGAVVTRPVLLCNQKRVFLGAVYAALVRLFRLVRLL